MLDVTGNSSEAIGKLFTAVQIPTLAPALEALGFGISIVTIKLCSRRSLHLLEFSSAKILMLLANRDVRSESYRVQRGCQISCFDIHRDRALDEIERHHNTEIALFSLEDAF